MGKLYFFLVVVISLSHSVGSAYVTSKQALEDEFPGQVSWLQEVFPGYDKLSYEWLQQTIRDNNVSSIEELLPLLPEALRKSYTLVKESSALQGADEKNPRAILFAPDARLVLAFNGADYQERFQHLEVLDYTASDGSARLFEIDFSKTGEEKFSAANSATCMKCHSSYPKPDGEAKPIWPNYNSWFGSYGESDDRIEGDELDQYKQFTELQKDHPRYKWLIRESDVHKYAPYYRNAAQPTDDSFYPGQSQNDHYQDNGVSVNPRNPRFMPGLRLSKALDARNAKRVATRLMQHESYQKFKWGTLFALTCVPKGSKESFRNNPEYLPDGIPQLVLGDFGLDPSVFTILFADDRADYHTGNATVGTDAMVAYHVAKDVFSTVSDYDSDGVSRIFTPNYWRVYYSVFSLDKTANAKQTETYKYLWAWSYLMDEVSPAFSTRSWSRVPKAELGYSHNKAKTSDLACAELGQMAIDEIAGREDQHPELFEDRGRFKTSFYGMKSISSRGYRDLPTIRKQCADCHDPKEPGVNFAPYIPFGDEFALRLFVQSEQRGETNRFLRKVERYIGRDEREAHLGGRRMPLGRKSLNDSESAALKTYLEAMID